MTSLDCNPTACLDDVLRFWFEETPAARHFAKNAAFDALIRARFGATHAMAARAELFQWREYPRGRLAEIIILDQFSRNLYRDDARAFACDPMALALAQEAIRAGVDRELPASRQAFVYMPFMHSESACIHEQAEKLFRQPGLQRSLKYERAHRAIIRRFGRYPYRNAALGRVSTPEELAFLKQAGSPF